MSLDLGELVGSLRMDVLPFDTALSKADTGLTTFGSETASKAKAAGDEIGQNLGSGVDSALTSLMASLPVTAKGAVDKTSAEFKALSPALRTAVQETEAQAHFDKIPDAARSAMAAAEAAIAGSGAPEAAAQEGAEAASRFSDEFKSGAKDAGKLAGAGLGLAIGVGVADNLSVEGGLNKVAVQLGLSQGDMKIAGQVAGAVYANNFGEDLPQINDALRNVIQNMNIDIGSASLQPITEQVLTLVDAFDQDLGMTTAAVGQMIRTGMVKDAQEGLDVLTAGLQTPANKADDLAETMNEYGTQFRKLGLDGVDAMGLLSQGLQGGARDADIVADSLKEFSLKTQEATTTVTKLSDGTSALNTTELGHAFEAVGVKVLDMDGNLAKAGQTFQKDLAGGGEKARAALDKVLDGMNKIKDPVEKNRVAVALFGTTAEDLGGALGNMDLDKAAGELGKVEGASQAAVDQMGSGAQATIDGYSRKLIDMGRDAIESTGPTAAIAGAVAAFGPAVLGVMGPIASLIAARGVQTAAAGTAAVAETAATGATVTGWIAAAAASTAGALKMAASWIIAMGPIGLAIAAIAGVVFLVVKYWDEIKEFTADAWDAVVGFVKDHALLIIAVVTGPLGLLIALLIKHWDDVKDGVVTGWTAVTDWLKAVPGKIVGFFSGAGALLKDKGKEILQGLKDGAEDKWNAVKEWVANVPERFTTAVGAVANLLKDKGREILQGLKDGASEKWDAVVGWVQGIPERFLNNVGGVANLLSEKGRDVIQSLRDGAEAKWTALVEWVSGIGGRILTNVGNLGNLLKDAGIAIVQGLIDGITEKFEDLKSKVGDITGWIKDHKGPKSYDLTLWRGPGNWIMQGLITGLDDQMPALSSKVGDVTDSIANAPMPTLMASVAPNVPESNEVATYAASQAGTAKDGDTYNLYEVTNAEATAAEVSRRQGLAGVGA